MRAKWLAAAASLLAGGLLLVAHPRLRAFTERNARRVLRILTSRVEAPRPAKRATSPEALSAWVVGDSTKIFPGDVLDRPAVGPGQGVDIAGARGESLAFQVVLAARGGRPRITLEISDLEGERGRIPRSRIETFLEAFMPCPPTPQGATSLGPGEHPDALIPMWDFGFEGRPIAHPFPVLPGRNQPVWVDVNIPQEAGPGRYRGELRFVSTETETVRVAVTLEVYGFDIPRTPQLTAWVPMYFTRLAEAEDFEHHSKEEAREILWRYYRMAHAHRFWTQIAEEEPRIAWDAKTGELRSVDWTEYDARNGPVLDGSLFEDGEPPPLWKVGGFMGWGKAFGGNPDRDRDITPARRRALAEYALEIERHFRERGFTHPRLFMYLIDEPDFRKNPNAAHLVKAYGDAIHAAKTRIGHLVTVSPHDSPVPLGAVDIWAVAGSRYYPARLRERQARGELAWFYQQHEPFLGGNNVDDEALGLRSWAWIAWRYRVDGIFLWVGNFWNTDPYRDPKNWEETQLGNGVLFYPGSRLVDLGHARLSGPVSSLRMKALRRGLLDYEYFRLLRDLGGDPDGLVSGIVRSALNEGEWEPMWHHPRWGDHGAWSHDPAEWDAVRHKTARRILERLRP